MGLPAKGLLAVGQIVVLAFPYTDLSDYKLRPVILLADAGNGDWLTVQITSNPYADPRAIPLMAQDFAEGGLALASFVRPAKLFTAHFSLITGRPGTLKSETLGKVRTSIIDVIRRGVKSSDRLG